MAAFKANKFVWSAISKITSIIWLISCVCRVSCIISSLSAREWVYALSILVKASLTTASPCSALLLVSADALDATKALWATSWTVEFISFMAVADSPIFPATSMVYLLDCSICADSSVVDVYNDVTMPPSCSAADIIPSWRACSASSLALLASSVATLASRVCSNASRLFSSAALIFSFKVCTILWSDPCRLDNSPKNPLDSSSSLRFPWATLSA